MGEAVFNVEPILEVQDVYSGYGKFEVLHGVSIHVDPGEIVCIIGPNGSGKSTLLKTIFGLLKPKKGRIHFAGREITGHEPEKITETGMVYIPQGKNIFPSLTVRENLEMGGTPLKDSRVIDRTIRETCRRFRLWR